MLSLRDKNTFRAVEGGVIPVGDRPHSWGFGDGFAPATSVGDRPPGLAAPDHTVPYGTVLLEGRFPRHSVPGYDHAVPPGRNTFRAVEGGIIPVGDRPHSWGFGDRFAPATSVGDRPRADPPD